MRPRGRRPSGIAGDVENGVREALEAGVVAGFPVTDLRAALIGGSTHTPTRPGRLQDRRHAGLPRSGQEGQPVLLEPLMRLEIVARTTISGTSSGTSTPGGGRSRAWRCAAAPGSSRGTSRWPRCSATRRRSDADPGPGVFTMEFARYERTPAGVQDDIVARVEGRVPSGPTLNTVLEQRKPYRR